MNCPHCNHPINSVVDSRPKKGTTWRRRECDSCKARWTTLEYKEEPGRDSARKALEELKSDLHALIDGLSI